MQSMYALSEAILAACGLDLKTDKITAVSFHQEVGSAPVLTVTRWVHSATGERLADFAQQYEVTITRKTDTVDTGPTDAPEASGILEDAR